MPQVGRQGAAVQEAGGQPFRAGTGALLERWSGRPLLVAVAAINAITGLATVVILAPLIFGDDADTFRRCALFLAEGRTDCSFPYPPLAALVARPLTWVSSGGAAVAMTVIGLAILLSGVALETRGRAAIDRVLVAVAALGFGPVVHELLLGQTTLLIAAALYPAVRREDAFRTGVPLGVALAVAPKPMLLPVLAWMLVWRRRSLAAALLAALLATGLGVALTGVGQYRDWVSVATGFGHVSLAGEFAKGNFSLLGHGLTPVAIALVAVVGLATLWVIVRDEARGFVAALFAGLLVAPYTQLYAPSILVLAVRPALAFAPRGTRLLVLVANPVILFMFGLTAWSLVGLAVCVPWSVHGRASAPAGRQ